MKPGIYPFAADIPANGPKLRWRKHELIVVSVASAIGAAHICRDWLTLTPQRLESEYVMVYNSNHTRFDYPINVLLPKIGSMLLIYLSYLAITRLIVPTAKRISLKDTTEKIIKKISWLIVQFFLLSFLIGLGTNLATYFAHPYFFNYGGFQFLALFGYNNHPLKYVFFGFDRAMSLIALFLGLALVRELIIHFIERPDYRRPYRILIANQLTTFGLIYLSVLCILAGLQFDMEDFFPFVYIFVVPATFLVFMINTYWLFPSKGGSSISHYLVLLRLLLATSLCTFGIFILPGSDLLHGRTILLLYCWAGQLFVTTPISWMIYRQRKERILQLRGLEKELIKSKADLKFLRSQINPHFLFNAMNTLYGTALREKSADTAKGIQMLGDMMRFMLHENTIDFIPIRKEIEYLKNYISLQKLRIETSPEISIESKIEERDCALLIAPMLLIPFVENAFKHGVSLEEPSWIKIVLTCDEKNICFEVRNSLHSTPNNDPEKDSSGIGLNNVQERLKLVYPSSHRISISQENNEFIIQLTIQP